MLLKMSKTARTLGLGAESGLRLGRTGSQLLGALVERHMFGWQALAFSPHWFSLSLRL